MDISAYPHPDAVTRQRRRMPLAALAVAMLFVAVLGAFTPPQKAEAAADGPKDVIAVMFSWTWNAIAQECTDTLGPAGYGYVQTSPPQEHVKGSQWWTYYQPVSYRLESRLGTEAEFTAMIKTCNDAGVKVIVDAVINHMSGQSAGGVGWAGSSFGHYDYPGIYSDGDFHSCRKDIANYQNRDEVQNCNLVNLSDLNTGSQHVQQTIADYLNRLVDLGASGFRIDAVKHISASDMSGIMSKVKNKDDLYIVQEVIRANEPIQPEEYLGNGDIHEFAYARKLKEAFGGGTISWLTEGAGIGSTWSGFLSSANAGVFVDNHDTERNGETLSYKNGAVYDLAQIFTLAWNYGSPSVHSGYTFSDYNAGPPQTGSGEVIDPTCGSGSVWTCEHSKNSIANMVGFRVATYGSAITNKWTNGSSAIAFGRGDKGSVVINRGAQFTQTFTTSLPDGQYYNVITATRNGSQWSGETVTVAGGKFTATVPANGAVALHAGAKAGATQCTDTTAPTAPTNVAAAASGTSITVSWTASTDDCAVTGYSITRTGGTGGSKTLNAAGTATSIVDSGLAASTAYTYAVTATDGTRQSTASTTASATTAAAPVGATTQLFYKAKSGWSSHYAHYRVGTGAWTTSPGVKLQEVCTGWYGTTIELGQSTSMTAAFNNGSGTWDNNGAKDYVLSSGVQAIADGKVTAANPCDVPAPGAAMTVYYKSTSGWSDVYAHYRIGTGPWTAAPGVKMPVACDGWSSLKIDGAAAGATFAFNNGAGQWDNNGAKDYVVSGEVVTVTGGKVAGQKPCDVAVPAPTTPTGVSATATNDAVSVKWTASTAASGIASYTVTRSSAGSADVPVVVAGTSYVDSTVSQSTTYSYTVKATAVDGSVSLASDAAKVTTPGTTGGPDTQAPTVPGDVKATASGADVTVTWKPSTDNVAVKGYRVQRTAEDEPTVGIITQATEIGFFGLTPGTDYRFSVQALDAAGNASAWTAPVGVTTGGVSDTSAPSIPSGLVTTAAGTSVTLSWNPSTDDSSVASYTVKRSDGTTSTEKITTEPTATFDDLAVGTTYTFTVKATDTSDNTSAWSAAVTVSIVGGTDPAEPGIPVGTDYSAGFYTQNPNGSAGTAAAITVDGDASEWTSAQVIAQGVANDDPRTFRGGHEGPVYDLYSLSSAWDDTNLYLMWQFTNVTDVVDPAQGYPISDNGKPYNGDIPQMLAFDVDATGGDGLIDGTTQGVWGIRTTFANEEVDHLAMFSSKPGVGQPAMFSLNASGSFDYEPANVSGFKTAGIAFAYGDGFFGDSLMGIKSNGFAGFVPADLKNTSAYVDFLSTGHDTAQDTVYEMKIPFAALGTTRAAVEEHGIGVALLSTFGQSAIGSLPQDPATLDAATAPYTADASTSAEKEDWDPITAQFARIGG